MANICDIHDICRIQHQIGGVRDKIVGDTHISGKKGEYLWVS